LNPEAAPMLVSIFTAPGSQQPLVRHEAIEAIANVGLADDRYAKGNGFYSGDDDWDAHVTLIESEPFHRLAAAQGIRLDPEELRRNLVTQGVDLSALIGREFRVGKQVILRGRKAWPPCSHIVKVSGRAEIFQYLAKHCGIGAEVVVGGTIRVGDAIEEISGK
jgi:MOSC domain-containing protein YiiM